MIFFDNFCFDLQKHCFPQFSVFSILQKTCYSNIDTTMGDLSAVVGRVA